MISLAGPIALLFPGQGVQKPGMGKSLHDRYPAARRAFERAGEVLEPKVEEMRVQASEHGKLWVANRNADVQFVLSGQMPAVQEAERLALEAGARRALILTIPVPAHTPLMEHAAAAFRKAVDRLQFKPPAFPVLANASGEAMRTVTALQDELRQQMLRQVDWARTMVSMKTMKVRTVVELGPGPGL